MAKGRETFLGANVILYCRRWRETVAFYRDRMNLPVSFECDWFVEFRVTDSAYLSVADERRSEVKSAAGAGVTVTFRVEDVDATHSRLVAAGLEVGPVREHPWGAHLFRFHDPEGKRLELWAPRD